MAHDPHIQSNPNLEGATEDLIIPTLPVYFEREDHRITLGMVECLHQRSNSLDRNAINFIKNALESIGIKGVGPEGSSSLYYISDLIVNLLSSNVMATSKELSNLGLSLNGVRFDDKFIYRVRGKIVDNDIEWETEVVREIEVRLDGIANAESPCRSVLNFAYSRDSNQPKFIVSYIPVGHPNAATIGLEWEQFDNLCRAAKVEPLYSTNEDWQYSNDINDGVELVGDGVSVRVSYFKRDALAVIPPKLLTPSPKVTEDEDVQVGGNIVLIDLPDLARRKILNLLKISELEGLFCALGDPDNLRSRPDPELICYSLAKFSGGSLAIGYECYYDTQTPVVTPFLRIELPLAMVGKIEIVKTGGAHRSFHITHIVPEYSSVEEDLDSARDFRVVQRDNGLFVDWNKIKTLGLPYAPEEPDSWR